MIDEPEHVAPQDPASENSGTTNAFLMARLCVTRR
jgi:hypothetical protein